MSERILQEHLHEYNTPTHTPLNFDFAKLSCFVNNSAIFLFLCYICLLLGGMSGEGITKLLNFKESALFASPRCPGLYLMYIQAHTVILQSPLVGERMSLKVMQDCRARCL